MKKIITHGLALILLCFPLQLLGKQKVLIIESYHNTYRWDQSYIKGIQSVFKDNYELSYFQMDTKRLPKKSYQKKADQAWLYYQSINPDLVIIGDDNALRYLAARFSKAATPVIYLGINNNPRYYNIRNNKNITGVLERPLIKRGIPTVAQLLPEKVTDILLMFDNSLTSQTIWQEIFSSKTKIIISGINVEISLIADWESWQSKLLNTAGNYDAVFFGLFHTLTDQNNKHISAEQVLLWSAENTPIPPFAFWDFAIGQKKAIGGLVLFGYEQGKRAAEMAVEILTTGKQAYLLGTKTAEKGRYMFSRKALQKYGIILPEKLSKNATFVD